MKNCFKESHEPKIGDLIKVSQYRDALKDVNFLYLKNEKTDKVEDVGNGAVLLFLGKEENARNLRIHYFYFNNGMYRCTDPDETVYRVYNWELVECNVQ